MSEEPSSPKRRYILSSFNTDDKRSRRRHRSPSPEPPRRASPAEKPPATKPKVTETTAQDDTTQPRRSRLRLKDHKSRRRRSRSPTDREDSHHRRSGHHGGDNSSSGRHNHRHRRRRHRHHRSPTPPNPQEPQPLDAEAAFRESLFDAMADDEGAAYWESVYGQPVHVYPTERAGPTGELEQMTDEEYAAYVRQKMWEKTHAGLMEEKAKREEARKEKEKAKREGRKIQEQMEQSLRKGEERRERRKWRDLWEEYLAGWAGWDGSLEAIKWPTEDRKSKAGIQESGVRTFFVKGLGLEELGEKTFAAKLREERVRWHPDKIQQKLGGEVDEEVMKDVTAIFQIIDRLWSEVRAKA